MLEIALHTGTEHPELVWVALPSAFSFAVGVLVGKLGSREDTGTDPEIPDAKGVEER